MASPINIRVAAWADDVYTSNGTLYPTGALYVGNSFYIIDYPYASGMRFLGVAIPVGATITTAYITFTASDNMTADTVRVKLFAEDGATPATFSTYANFIGRTPTTAQVDWDFTTDWATNSTYNSAEIKTIIQELVNSYDYSAGLNIVLFANDDGSTTGQDTYSKAYSYDDSTSKAPLLHIEYTTPGWANIAKINGVLSSSIAKVNGIAVASIAKVNGVSV